jgi:RimJ/RimL family protein N-acetyltransferase
VDLTPHLEGELVALEPFADAHAEELWEAAQAPEIFGWLESFGESRERFDSWFQRAIEGREAGTESPFAVRRRADGKVVGSSRYLAVRPADRVVEIGWTWFEPSVWRSGVNLETKLLLLGHAFESLGCVRVELKTDARNERSRTAIAALPAQFEGILRKHMIVPDVGQRDTAYFSVVDDEWPGVRANLERRFRH